MLQEHKLKSIKDRLANEIDCLENKLNISKSDFDKMLLSTNKKIKLIKAMMSDADDLPSRISDIMDVLENLYRVADNLPEWENVVD